MTPNLKTPEALQPILQMLKKLEPLVYAANDGHKREYFEKLLAPEFWEIAASGQRYSRAYVLDALAERQQNPFEQDWKAEDYYLQQLAADLYLMTYTLHQPTRVSQRTSLWKRNDDHWQFVYHQGSTCFD